MKLRILYRLRRLDEAKVPSSDVALRYLRRRLMAMSNELVRAGAADAVDEQRVVDVLKHTAVPRLDDVLYVLGCVDIASAGLSEAEIAELPRELGDGDAVGERDGVVVVEVFAVPVSSPKPMPSRKSATSPI